MGKPRYGRAERRGERGASLTEFAVVVPLFLALVYGSLHLCDLGVFKLKAQEIARYGAWGLTQRPLSNYGDARFNHEHAFDDARDEISAELNQVYVDLDGAHRLALPGASAKTMSAVLAPSLPTDFRNREAQVVPDWGNAQLAEPFSVLGLILEFLGVGTDLNDLVTGPARRMNLNEKGQVTFEAAVSVLPPIRPEDARQAITLARVGRSRGGSHVGADLSPWLPAGRVLRDSPGREIQTTLVADSWRITQGWSTWPRGSFASPESERRKETHYANVVKEVSQKGLTALPLGQILQFVLSLEGFFDHLPTEVTSAIYVATGLPAQSPDQHVMSRPYTAARRRRPPVTTDGRDLAAGQVEIFSDTGGTPPINGVVRKLETGPLYYNPQRPENSTYLEALNKRGPNFMGCDQRETRGCWETR